MLRRRSSRNSLTSRDRRFDSRLDVNAQQITSRRIVGRRAAKRFARLREVARIAAGFEVTGFEERLRGCEEKSQPRLLAAQHYQGRTGKRDGSDQDSEDGEPGGHGLSDQPKCHGLLLGLGLEAVAVNSSVAEQLLDLHGWKWMAEVIALAGKAAEGEQPGHL